MKPNWDPYNEIVKLNNFAKAADQHIGNLLQNEKEMVIAINTQSTQIKELQNIVKELKDEIARKT
jgi:hypothetical protein